MKEKKQYITEWEFPSRLSYGGIEYDYDTDRNNCTCDDICRCSRIKNIKVESVDFNFLVNYVVENKGTRKIKPTPYKKRDLKFFDYCVSRLAVIFKLWESDLWVENACVSRGYYGEYFDGFHFPTEFKNNVQEVYELNLNDRIRYVLNKEYGFLLPQLKDAKFNVEDISFKDIVVDEDKYIKKVNQEIYADYDENLPIGIYRKSGDQYRIIDGYHRYISLCEKRKTVKIIVAE